MWIVAGLVMLKSIFTDFGYDNAYQVAMSFRHLAGDRMFIHMWEPHQTSAFFTDLLLFIYGSFVPDYTGVVLFTQIIGTVVAVLVALAAVREIKAYTNRIAAHAALVFLSVFKVKQTPFIDYAGQMILLSILVFVFLLKWEKEGKTAFSAVAGLLTFLEVLSYPAALFSLIPACCFLVTSREQNRKKGVIAFLLGGGIPATVYAAYFIIKVRFDRLLETAKLIVRSDSHSTIPHIGEYWFSFLCAAVLVAACFAAGITVKLILRKSKDISALFVSLLLLTIAEPVLLFLTRNEKADFRCFIYIIPVVLILSAAFVYKRMTEEERRVWLFGVSVSLATFLAALVLSDLGFITVCAYLYLGGTVSFIGLKYLDRDCGRLAIVFTAIILLHRGIVVWGYGNIGRNVFLTNEVQNIVRDGPAFGIVCDHMNKAKFSSDLKELRECIGKDDVVLTVGPYLMDSLIFLYTDADISNYSVIDTPVYNETLDEYYRLNPEKFPTAVLVDCWFGNLNIPEDSFIMKWITKNFTEYRDLSYYRIYRR